jgi:hypothetical protein
LHAKYKFTCFLSNEVMSLIEHILVPEPELRYGLRQITSNGWFRQKYVAAMSIGRGVRVGYEDTTVFSKVLQEM